MHRKDDEDVRSSGDPSHRVAYSGKTAAEALATMARHQDQTLAFEPTGEHRLAAGTHLRAVIQQLRDPQQSVDPGIAGDDNPPLVDAFSKQILARLLGGGEMKIGDMRHQPAVHFLRPGRVDIIRAQARLDMRYRNFMVEGRQRPSERRCGVTLHDDPIGPKGRQDFADTR